MRAASSTIYLKFDLDQTRVQHIVSSGIRWLAWLWQKEHENPSTLISDASREQFVGLINSEMIFSEMTHPP